MNWIGPQGDLSAGRARVRADWARPPASLELPRRPAPLGLLSVLQRLYTAASSLLVITVLSPFIALKLTNAKRWLLGIILLELPIQLDVYLFYRPELDEMRASFPGLNFSLTTVCLAVLYGLWFSETMGEPLRRRASLMWRMTLPLASYVALVTLSMLTADDVTLAFFEVTLYWQTFLLYFYLVHQIRSRDDVLFVVTMLLVGLLVQGLLMVALWIAGGNIKIPYISTRLDEGGRVGGTIGSPNTAASYLTLLLAPALALFLTRVRRGLRFLAGLACMLGGVALILTLSRGGLIATAVSMALLVLFGWHRGWISWKAPVFTVLAALVVLALFSGPIAERISDPDQGSAYSRIPLMRLAFAMISENPVLGIGANNFTPNIGRYLTIDTGAAYLSAVHNRYLLIWAESGFLALLAFLWFLLSTIRRGWRCWLRRDPLLSPLALAFSVAIAGQMIHMTVARFSGRAQVQFLWLVAALITAMYAMESRSPEGGSEAAGLEGNSGNAARGRRHQAGVIGVPGRR